MNKWILAVCVALLGGVLFMTDADARRFGGGRTVGTQRNVTTPPQQQNAAPAGQQAAPAQRAPQAAPAPAGNRWAGILGGLALGGLLGYLFGGSGLMGLLLVALLAIGAVMVVRALMHKPAPQPMQFAGMGKTEFSVAQPGPAAPPAARAAVPAGFDTDSFLRGAKMNFVKLQLANDRAELDEIREFTTPELFGQLKSDVLAREGRQETDITALEAELLDLATENGQYWASVRFSGMDREAPGADPVRFGEVWNLVKPVDGSSGWLLAGIQQMH